MVLSPLRWVQQPPLLCAEVHGHVQEGHRILQRHTCVSGGRSESLVGTEERLGGTFQQSSLCWCPPALEVYWETLPGARKRSNECVLRKPESGAQAGVPSQEIQVPQTAFSFPKTSHRELPLGLPRGRAADQLQCDQSFRDADQDSGSQRSSTALCVRSTLPTRGRTCLRSKRLEHLNTAMPEACLRPLIT